MRMFPLAAILSLAVSLAPAVVSAATPGTLRAIDSAAAQAGFEGVGRLDVAGTSGNRPISFCTAALVSPTLVLTAAHCVHDAKTGDAHRPDRMTFRAALRHGVEAATRKVRRVSVDPRFTARGRPNLANISVDLALLELDRPVVAPQVRPFAASGRMVAGDRVQVVSYAQGRSEAPAREENCEVLDRDFRILVLSCQVDFGASGSPVFMRTEEGLRIVSVISAKGRWGGRTAAYAVAVEAGIEELSRGFSRNASLPVDATMPGMEPSEASFASAPVPAE